MKRWNWVFVAPVVMFVAILFGNAFAQEGTGKPTKEAVMQKAQKLRMPFIANEGQADKRVAFYAQTFGGTVFVTKDGEIVYALPGRGKDAGNKGEGPRINARETTPSAKSEILDLFLISCREPISGVVYASRQPEFQAQKTGVALKEELVGRKVNRIEGMDQAATRVSYFKGNDPSKWKQDISTYDIVMLGEVYTGIDVTLKAYGDNVEKLFCVRPGANADQIKIQLSGARELRINKDGQLEAETELGPVKFTKPVAYQEIDGKKIDVEVDYTISNPHSQIPNPKSVYSFTVASYDQTKDLIIDPLLASTFLGGNDYDIGHSIALDTRGNVYVTGQTVSSDFPTTAGAYDTSMNLGAGDVFISKLDGGLTSLLASTYLGGHSFDAGISLTIDTSGNVYVMGVTGSSSFPITAGAYDISWNSFDYRVPDVFVSKLDGELTTLIASTFLGGDFDDYGYSIALDTRGNVYVTGQTVSSDFPTTAGAYDTSTHLGVGIVFISKLDDELTSLLASTFLGGSDYDIGHSIALDTRGNVYVTGETLSSDFPTTAGAYDTSLNGDIDVFISKLNDELTSLLASTFLGGSDYDIGHSIALDTSGNVYVTGYTDSPDFPTTAGAYDTSLNGDIDVFISKLDSGLTSLTASTFLGGSDYDIGHSIALDTSGNVYVTGATLSSDFPTTSGAYDTSWNSGYRDAFVSKLDGELTTLIASTFLGGDFADYGYSIALGTHGNVYVTGETLSSDFPTTSGAYDTSWNSGQRDAFVSILDGNLSAGAVIPTPTPSPSPTPEPSPSPSPTPEITPTPIPSPTCSPTAITLAYFHAKAGKNGRITLTWETATEVDNAGFNLYRSKRRNGHYTQVNNTIIPAQSDAISGANYRYIDTPGKGTFYYKLGDVDYYGKITLHGPEKVRVGLDNTATKRRKRK